MTTNPPDRLDRIEAILANLAQRDETFQQHFEQVARPIDLLLHYMMRRLSGSIDRTGN
ncbi:MAG: hypothetical protein LH660_08555 [Phormidesmis sp. CAN_BIN36]|nr:hypothetical protein [Phormidesmis sp. CAN_BIN36]